MLIRISVFLGWVGIILVLGWSGGLLAEPVSSKAGSHEGARVESGQRFIHTVLFWLKDGTTDSKKKALIKDCKDLLGSIATVKYLAAGEPAGTPREVVDNSFDVGLVVHFEDSTGHDVYQTAEKHLEFIERNNDIWERVQVYDITIP
ncbi:MAG TPA: Dabb family protein [Acidobacteriota bacterium]|nr:Dabb family protein [Acidobacteriota bacterium]